MVEKHKIIKMVLEYYVTYDINDSKELEDLIENVLDETMKIDNIYERRGYISLIFNHVSKEDIEIIVKEYKI